MYSYLSFILFIGSCNCRNYFPSFSLAQRKEAKETSTYPHPLPIWRGSTENCGYRQFSEFIKVKSGIKARFCFFFGLRQVVGANHHSPSSPLAH
jgi:hypothetical protein